MTTSRISALPTAVSVTDATDYVPVVVAAGPTTKKALISTLTAGAIAAAQATSVQTASLGSGVAAFLAAPYVTPFKISSRITALDANHLHAWELTESSGNFVDTGSSPSKVNLTSAGAILYASPGIVGSCPVFGVSAAGAPTTGIGASALVSAFSDLPTTSCTLEFWFRSYTAQLHFLAGVCSSGTETFDLNDNGSTQMLGLTVRATNFDNGGTSSTYQPSSPYVWHHLALVYDQTGGNVFLYLDGELVRSFTGQSGPVQWSNGTTPKFMLANDILNSAGQYIGQMSRLRLSNIARSQAYCRTVYQTGMAY